jgi:LacI family transcriptional regulator
MSAKRLPRVALILESARTFGRDLIRGIMRYSRMHGPWVFPWIYYKDDILYKYLTGGSKNAELEQLRKWRPDGIITDDSKDIEKLMGLNIPLFVTGGVNPFDPHRNNIISDDFVIARMAAEYLLERGFRYFGYCGVDNLFWSRLRCESFAARIAGEGFKTYIYRQPKSRADRAWSKEEKMLMKWLRSLPKPIAVMAGNDIRGQHIIEACSKAKLEVPYEVAVIGVDNDDFVCNITNPPLSSVVQDAEMAGFQVGVLLDKMMAGKKMPPQTVIAKPTRIITRQSTNIVAVEDALVSKALNFIHENAKRPIQVSSIIKALKVSRSHLNEKFMKTLRRSAYSEIKRVRTDLICQMLFETDLPISDISLNLGYDNANHFARFFKQRTGITPTEYRNLRGYK